MRGASGCVLGSGCYVSPAAADHGTSPSGPGWLATAPRPRRRPARSCVYVSAAKSWWEIGKNDPACLYLTVYCPPAARRAAVCSCAEETPRTRKPRPEIRCQVLLCLLTLHHLICSITAIIGVFMHRNRLTAITSIISMYYYGWRWEDCLSHKYLDQ